MDEFDVQQYGLAMSSDETHVHPRAALAVDLAVFTVTDADLKVLLICRGEEPFAGCWALPGGHVEVKNEPEDQGEDLDVAAHRELEEETGLPAGSCHLEQLYTFGAPGRDPRGRVVSVGYLALVRSSLAPHVNARDDAADARWVSVNQLWERGHIDWINSVLPLDGSDPAEPPTSCLAFDHPVILRMALARLRGKIDYAPLAFDLVPEAFTVAELREVYEVVKGRDYNAANFHRRFKRMLIDRVIQVAPGKRATGGRRALVYRFVKAS